MKHATTHSLSVSSVSSVVKFVTASIEKEILPRLQGEQAFGAVAVEKKCHVLGAPVPRVPGEAAPRLYKAATPGAAWQKGDAFMLAYVQRGEADFFIGRRRISCPAGNFVLLFPSAWRSPVNGPHCFSLAAGQAQSHILWLTIKPGVVVCHTSHLHNAAMDESKALFIPDSRLHPLVPGLRDELLNETADPANACRLLWLFFDRVRRKLHEDSFLMTRPTPEPEAPGDPTPNIGEKALRYVEANLREKLTLESVARAIFSTRTRVAHDFKAHTGVPLGTYLQRRRLEQAKLLLDTTPDSIKIIARRAGFSDADYFCAAFRKSEGMTPSEYRERR